MDGAMIGGGGGAEGYELAPTLHALQNMARGFESKSVESQQSETFERSTRRERPSAEDVERRHKRESLELSRGRVSRELEGARSPVHRAALENALRFLEEELRKV